MARYYLHLRDGIDELLDPDGQEFADPEALARGALEAARDVMSGDIMTAGIVDLRCRIDAEDKDGRVLYSLPFEAAVLIQYHR